MSYIRILAFSIQILYIYQTLPPNFTAGFKKILYIVLVARVVRRALGPSHLVLSFQYGPRFYAFQDGHNAAYQLLLCRHTGNQKRLILKCYFPMFEHLSKYKTVLALTMNKPFHEKRK